MNRNEGVFVNVGSSPCVQQQAVTPSPAACLPTGAHRERYKKVLFSMGMVEIIIGSLSTILGIASLVIAASNHGYYERDYIGFGKYELTYHAFNHVRTYVAQGVWCGVFAIVVGIMGVRARSSPSRCVYNATMVLSIIGANVMGILSVLSATTVPNPRASGLAPIHSCLMFLGGAGAVIMILHSAFCCAGVCCTSNQAVTMSYYLSPTGMQQPQPIQLANGQYVSLNEQETAASCVPQVPVLSGPVAHQQQAQVGAPPLYAATGVQQDIVEHWHTLS